MGKSVYIDSLGKSVGGRYSLKKLFFDQPYCTRSTGLYVYLPELVCFARYKTCVIGEICGLKKGRINLQASNIPKVRQKAVRR